MQGAHSRLCVYGAKVSAIATGTAVDPKVAAILGAISTVGGCVQYQDVSLDQFVHREDRANGRMLRSWQKMANSLHVGGA